MSICDCEETTGSNAIYTNSASHIFQATAFALQSTHVRSIYTVLYIPWQLSSAIWK
jgi:hypothetical protein